MNLSMPLARSFSRSPESVSEACEVAITSGPLPVNSKAVFMERLLDELHDGKQWYDHSICLFYQNHHRGPSPNRWPPPGRHHHLHANHPSFTADIHNSEWRSCNMEWSRCFRKSWAWAYSQPFK